MLLTDLRIKAENATKELERAMRFGADYPTLCQLAEEDDYWCERLEKALEENVEKAKS